jgi:hypothetical protein
MSMIVLLDKELADGSLSRKIGKLAEKALKKVL